MRYWPSGIGDDRSGSSSIKRGAGGFNGHAAVARRPRLSVTTPVIAACAWAADGKSNTQQRDQEPRGTPA